MNLGDLALVSNSPERFLTLDAGDDFRIETRPIKGTRRRGLTIAQDQALIAELCASAKDQAENLMIVDLMRNDLARVSPAGSVETPELFAVESFANVHHLVSTVTARLAPGLTAVDLLRAKGLAAAAKKSSRTAAEGLVGIAVAGTKGVAVEVNSESDFVAKNAEFQKLAEQVVDAALASKAADVDALNAAPISGGSAAKTVEETIAELSAKIGDSSSASRFTSAMCGWSARPRRYGSSPNTPKRSAKRSN
jgi:hypothetical protein